MNRDWQSYDSAAADHDRLAVPAIFAEPAGDLVARTRLPHAGRILDLGTGTGIAARLAVELAPPGTVVMGLDPSLKMLRVARNHGLLCLAAGAVPGLPYPDAVFDRILGNFVLSHLPSYAAALLDIVRVLRPRGKLGMTTWGVVQNQFRELWQELAEAFVDREALRTAAQTAVPWEDWFTDAGHLREAFEDAGLIDVEVHSARYATSMTIADFLALRENSIQGRYMRQILEGRRWQEFRQTVSTEFHRRFADPIEHARDAHIATGTHP